MKATKLSLIALVASITLFTAGVSMANVPAPPVNQILGFDDTIFNALEEADCRVCHDDPTVTGPTPNVDRHHLLYGSPLPQGECSVNSNACLSDADCDPGICSRGPEETCTLGVCNVSGDPCNRLADCPPGNTSCDGDLCDDAGLGETCGEVCIGETVVPFLDADGDGSDDSVYSCLSCHAEDNTGGIISFLVERDCLVCHIQIPGEASVHHLLPVAQGTDSPIGDPDVGDCTPCHGTIVDDVGDGHVIPTYNPSLVTPAPSLEPATPGGCNYCHDAGEDTVTGVDVFTNEDNHHNTGVFRNEVGETNQDACNWCHNTLAPEVPEIRFCEGCHGLESLHNIQADSNGDGVVPLGELYGYGHIGIDNPPDESDCWGCHGFSVASDEVEIGSGVPTIYSAIPQSMTAGSETIVTVSGAALSNATTLVVRLTDTEENILTLDPNDVTDGSLTVVVNAPAGNYTLQTVKDGAASNALGISIKPEVVITEIDCSKCLGSMTITGSGFAAKPDGTDEDLYVIEGDGGKLLKVISWTETEIQVLDARCRGDVTVNALFGSATSGQ